MKEKESSNERFARTHSRHYIESQPEFIKAQENFNIVNERLEKKYGIWPKMVRAVKYKD